MKDVIKWAKESEMPQYLQSGEVVGLEALEKFAALVAAAERNRCAEVCDSVGANAVLGTAGECAAAIRGLK